MAENLNYYTSSGSWCYDDKSSNCDKYGRLCDWETAKKVCPDGWHLPSKSEFETLLDNFEGKKDAYNALIPSGSSGFYALFGGWRNYDGYFDYVGEWRLLLVFLAY
ncbi:MAG: FISUMP domain-containing protein [Bacteroidales bacterium]